MTARVIQTRPGLLRSAWRSIRLRILRWLLECLLDEREQYTLSRLAGPIYQRNSRQQELQLRERIRQLEQA